MSYRAVIKGKEYWRLGSSLLLFDLDGRVGPFTLVRLPLLIVVVVVVVVRGGGRPLLLLTGPGRIAVSSGAWALIKPGDGVGGGVRIHYRPQLPPPACTCPTDIEKKKSLRMHPDAILQCSSSNTGARTLSVASF